MHLYIATTANFTPSGPESSCVSGPYNVGLYAKAAGTILTNVPFMLAMCSSVSLCQIKLEMWLKKSQVNKIKVHKSKKGFVQDPSIYSTHLPGLSSHRTQGPMTNGDSPRPCWRSLPTFRTLASLAFLPQPQVLLPPSVTGVFYNLESSPLSLPE